MNSILKDFLGPEAIIGTLVIIGSIAVGLNRLKLLTFGKNSKCPLPTCHDAVVSTSARVDALEKGQEKIFKKLDDMPKEVVTLLKDTKGLLKT